MLGAPSHPLNAARNSSCSAMALNVPNSKVWPQTSGYLRATLDDPEAQVVFTGMVAEPAGYMASARALALSSIDEGLPMVVLEALSLGLPVLAADCPAGGVRAALVGGGAFDPARAEAEPTSSGLLLPVPRADSQDSLALWRALLPTRYTTTSAGRHGATAR